ncbi:MAG: hypothetical protein ACOY3L_12495 [Pseudomonadota bacterium]
MADGCTERAVGGTSRRAVARRLLALVLVLPVAACAGWRAAPAPSREECLARLRRMGQMSAKPGGRCN